MSQFRTHGCVCVCGGVKTVMKGANANSAIAQIGNNKKICVKNVNSKVSYVQ